MMGCPNWQLLLKIAEFYKPEGIKRETTWKWILTLFKYKNEYYKQSRESRWKNEVTCLGFKFLTRVMTLNLPRKMNFLQFCANFSKKPKSVKAIYILHLKVLTTDFQKMIWFIEVWATLYEILRIKISKNMLNQQKFNKIICFRTLTSPKTYSHSIINNYHYLKVQKEIFQMHIRKLL